MVLIHKQIDYAGTAHTLEVSTAFGAGGTTYTVNINNYCVGTIVRYTKYDKNHNPLYTYWHPIIDYSKRGSILTIDDVDAIVEAIEENHKAEQ